uniref:Uncharacterized protein n=1 Tax=Anopheles quadriannulatus TaxID=34691 RepID=A0A182XSG4_ANOQN
MCNVHCVNYVHVKRVEC